MSARKQGGDIDLAGNALLNAILQVLASAPANATTAGRLWFNSADHTVHFGDGTSDVAVGGNSYTDEQAVDAVAAALTQGTGISIVYNDPANTITISVSGLTHTAISDFDTQVRLSRLDQLATPNADVSMGSHKLTNVTDGTATQDAATFGQLQAALQGRNDKAAVRAAATGNGTLATAYANGSVVDGVTLATGDRILLPLQTTGSDNGIYTVNASGAPSRAVDMDTGAEASNAFVWVAEGTTNADTAWKVMNDGTITLGTTALVISKVIAASIIAAGTGLTKTGQTLAVDHTVVPMLYTTTIGDGSTTSIVVTHNLGTRAVKVAVFTTASTYDEIDVPVQHTTTNTVTLLFNTAPTSGQYTVVVIG